jgi:hypothetical protein
MVKEGARSISSLTPSIHRSILLKLIEQVNFCLLQPLLNLRTHTLGNPDGSLGAIMLDVASIIRLAAGGSGILGAKARVPTFRSDLPLRRVDCGWRVRQLCGVSPLQDRLRKTDVAERGEGEKRRGRRELTIHAELPAKSPLDRCPEKHGSTLAIIVGKGKSTAVGRQREQKLAYGSGEQAALALLNALAADLGSAAAAAAGAEYIGAVGAGGGEGRDEGEDAGELHFEGRVDWLGAERWCF